MPIPKDGEPLTQRDLIEKTPQRPLPDTIAQLRQLTETLNKFIEICGSIGADTIARQSVNAKFDQIIRERSGYQQLADNTASLTDEQKQSLMAFLRRMEDHKREADALNEVLTVHRTATHVIGIETHGRGVGNYFTILARQTIQELRDEYDEATRSDTALRKIKPEGTWDEEISESFALQISTWRTYWSAIQTATQNLRDAAVQKMGSLEGKRQLDLEIVLDDDESAIVRLLQDAGRYMTTAQILEGLAKAGEIPADSTIKLKLSQMTKGGLLKNRSAPRPRGYGLPDWK